MLGGGEFAGGGWLQDVGAVEGVALLGAEAGFGDDAAKFFHVGTVSDSKRREEVFDLSRYDTTVSIQ